MHKFKSVLAPQMEQLIAYKAAMNMTIKKYETVLQSIDRYYVDHQITEPTVTKEIIFDWLESTTLNNKPITKSMKMGVVKSLCLHMAKSGIQTYIPNFTYTDQSTYIPYVFTDAEMQSIFETCANWRVTRARMHNAFFAIPAIIRLLYSTGMRVSEATQLTNEDINLKTGTITLNHTKNRKQRMIPICDSLQTILSQYIEARNKLPIQEIRLPQSPFFITADGKPYDKKLVYNWFRVVLEKANIAHKGRDFGPRIHDLRHTFAVHSLRKNIEAGKDIYCTLPTLCVFMGHANIYSTEKYVRLTQDAYPQLIQQIGGTIKDIFPHLNDSYINEDKE